MNCIEARVESMKMVCFCRPVCWQGLGVFVSYDGQLGGVPFDQIAFEKSEEWETVTAEELKSERDYLRSQNTSLPDKAYLIQSLLKRMVPKGNIAKKAQKKKEAIIAKQCLEILNKLKLEE